MNAGLSAAGELSLLRDPELLRRDAYIDGRWQSSADGAVLEVSNPATDKTLATVASLGAADAEQGILAAHRAFPSWRGMLPQCRAAYLKAWHRQILDHKDDLALLMTLEQGKPLSESLGEIDYAASFVEWYAEEGKRLNIEQVTSHLSGAEMSVRREPIGVVAVVTPWNFPSAMITRKAAAALAAGCTVVSHPSMETPLSALALAELASRARIPAGVFNVVTGPSPEIVEALCSSPNVRALSFTGSTEIGRRLTAKCAATMKRVVMELGGHAPFIVFEDVDLDKAVNDALHAKFVTTGQDCLAANRIYVQRPVYDRFLQIFVKRVRELKIGPGLERDVEIGPLMNAKAVAKCEAQVSDALTRGARCLIGGRRHSSGPLFFEPTILADVPPDALIMREETFGPIAAIAPFDHEAEVVAAANDTDYGLIAYLYTDDRRRISRIGRALEFGMVAVNRIKITGAPIPFGGFKQSGLAREGSRHGLEAFTEIKYLCFDID